MTDDRLEQHEFGFWKLVCPPSEAELVAYYAEKYYQSEQSNYRKNYPPEERHAIDLRIKLRSAKVSELRQTSRPGRLLDVGCGEGFVMAAYAAEGWDVWGMDHSKNGVEGMNPDLADRVIQGNLFALLEEYFARGEVFDLVWLGNVLEHVVDPVGLLRGLLPLMGPEGVLVATVPNDGSAYQKHLLRSGAIETLFWVAIPDHLSYFTRDSLTMTAQATGWVVHDVQGDFPIDLFLSHPGSNYVRDGAQGPVAHAARLQLEALIGQAGPDAANAFYSALAGVGLGRNITAYLSPQKKAEP